MTASAPLIQTDTSSTGQVVGQVQIANLPLNERNFVSFAYLAPGVQIDAESTLVSSQGLALSANGARQISNNFLLDGIDNNDLVINQYSALPSVDAIQEFKVQTGTYSAEFGRSSGAQVNVVLKSGANRFQGSAYRVSAEQSSRREERVRAARRRTAARSQPVRRLARGADCPRQDVLLLVVRVPDSATVRHTARDGAVTGAARGGARRGPAGRQKSGWREYLQPLPGSERRRPADIEHVSIVSPDRAEPAALLGQDRPGAHRARQHRRPLRAVVRPQGESVRSARAVYPAAGLRHDGRYRRPERRLQLEPRVRRGHPERVPRRLQR